MTLRSLSEISEALDNTVPKDSYHDFYSSDMKRVYSQAKRILFIPTILSKIIFPLGLFLPLIFSFNLLVNILQANYSQISSNAILSVISLILLLIKSHHIDWSFDKIFSKTKIFQKFNQYLLHELNLNNNRLKIFLSKITLYQEVFLHNNLIKSDSLYDLINNVNNNKTSIKNIRFFLQLDKIITDEIQKNKEEQNYKNKKDFIRNLQFQELKSIQKQEEKVENIEKQFNFLN